MSKTQEKHTPQANFFSIQALTKSFQGISAVQDMWLDVHAGERLSLLGPSGCGKSTTLQLIAGILPPDRGDIFLAGQRLNRVPPERRQMALVLQKGLLFPHLSVGENVAFGLKMRGMSRVEQVERAIAMLDQVQLSGFENRRPNELSGGQAQRVALARSLVIKPKVLLLDEPLSALDANLRGDMQDLILRLQRETGVTMIVVTHDQGEAVVMSDRIALMFEGHLRQVATPEALYQRPSDETVARFLGGVNFFTAEARDHQLVLPGGNILITDCSQQGLVTATIRPEQIALAADPIYETNWLSATVTQAQFTGTQRRLSLQVRDNNVDTLLLQAWVPPSQNFTVGQSVFAYLPADALWSFPGSQPSSGSLLGSSHSVSSNTLSDERDGRILSAQ
ncbi:MAG: ABC transporter ATP-binding protein [Phormidesmis sp.]